MSQPQPLTTHEFDFALSRNSAFRYRLLVDGKEQVSECREFRLNDFTLPRSVFRRLKPLEADLRDVAIALHLADRIACRKLPGVRDSAGQWWSRRIRIKLAVRCVERWEENAVKAALLEYLSFNTSDRWELEFVPREAPVTVSEAQYVIPFEQHQSTIVLWSGGLDSAAGLAHHMRLSPEENFTLISVNSSTQLGNRQKAVIKAMPEATQRRVTHVAISLNLIEKRVLTPNGFVLSEEKSLRTRGLLFLTAGTIAAKMMDSNQFFVFENGIGALNLPFYHAQIAGYTSRAVHPRSLVLFTRFVTALLRYRLAITNPYQFTTKGQLCRELDYAGWEQLVAASFTCSHPQRVSGKIQHCGVCTSCVLRRQGLRVAGLSTEDTVGYRFDLLSPEQIPAKKRKEWAAMHWQHARLKQGLNKVDPTDIKKAWLALSLEFPELEQTKKDVAEAQRRSEFEVARDFLRLFHTYVDEGMDLAPSEWTMLTSELSADESHAYIKAA